MINILHYRLGGKCFTKDLSANLSNHCVFLCIAEQLPRYSQPSYSTAPLISSIFKGHPVLGTQCFPYACAVRPGRSDTRSSPPDSLKADATRLFARLRTLISIACLDHSLYHDKHCLKLRQCCIRA